VRKTGRKGRISNELVAASCAAILTVYASGYWRTRDEARRFGSEAQTRRPMPPEPAVSPEAAHFAAVLPAAAAVPPVPDARPAATQTQLATAPLPAGVAAKPAVPVIATLAAVVEVKSGSETQAAIEATVPAEEAEVSAPTRKPWIDGYYTGWGQSRHGDIQAFVTISDNRITNAGVALCETRYPCSVIDDILHQPIEIQGPDVDRVSRATESADAYYYGLVKALENAETGTFRSVRP
jgi:uncharacterized protein with FMN-binding domain